MIVTLVATSIFASKDLKVAMQRIRKGFVSDLYLVRRYACFVSDLYEEADQSARKRAAYWTVAIWAQCFLFVVLLLWN